MEDTSAAATLTARATLNEATALEHMRSVLHQIDGAMHASVAMLSGDQLRVVASTDERIDAVGDLGDGPSAAVTRTGQIVRVPTVERDTEFPDYVAKCRRHGVSSMAGFPIKDAALRTVGVLTVSSADHHGFGPPDLRAGRRGAETLAALISKRHVAPTPSM